MAIVLDQAATGGLPGAPIRRQAKALALAAVLCLTTYTANADPSFDCQQAKTAAEHLICNDDALGDKDARLSEIYSKVRAGAGTNRSKLAAVQSQWLAERDQQCIGGGSTDEAEQIACLAEQYEKRIAELKPQQPGAVSNCAGSIPANTQAEFWPRGWRQMDGCRAGWDPFGRSWFRPGNCA